MFAYCCNNPVTRADPTGEAWWHWAVAAVAVAALVVVSVATCGGAAAAAGAAVSIVTGTCTSVSTVATVATGAALGASAAFAGSAVAAASNSESLEEFADYGAPALVNTIVGGVIGAAIGYFNDLTSCFIAGTLVATSCGDKPIETIKVGDLVWAWDEETGDIALKPVVETYINETSELMHIFVNHEEIICTPTHPFYSPVKGWTDAAKLRAGDILVLVNGEYVIVEQVQHELLESPVRVYNFQVEDYHTYYVSYSSILVHNACKPTSPDKVSDNALKKIDVHAFKKEFVSKNIAHWDVFKDTANNSVLWLGNKAQTAWYETGYFIKDLLEMFPK